MKYILIVLLFICQNIFAQTFITKISPKIIGRQDMLQVEYVATNVSIDQFHLPRFINWKIVSGPSVSQSKININGAETYETSYVIMLQPQIAGNIVIPGASALINNKPQLSNQALVQVRNVPHVGSQAPVSNAFPFPLPAMAGPRRELPPYQYLKKGENVTEKIKNNLLIRLEVSKKSCYVGEPVTATYKLCSRLRCQSKAVKQPTFSGCTVEELSGSDAAQHVEKINGREFNVREIRKVLLTPLNAGQLIVPAVEVENTVSLFTSNSRDIFGDPSGPVESHTLNLSNEPGMVNVIPLPSYTGSAMLSGGIGDFNISVKAAEPIFTNSGTNHLFVVVEGSGNLQAVKTPAIKWPHGIESFEATEREELDRDADPVISRKIFTVPFVADKTGSYILPPLSFTYFDPASSKYITKSTLPFLFTVVPQSKSVDKINPGSDTADFDQRLYIFLGVALLAIIGGIALYNVTHKNKPAQLIEDKSSEENLMAQPAAFNVNEYLFRIRETEPRENTADFYKQLNKNLCDYIFTKYKIQPSEIEAFAEQHLRISTSLLQLKNLIDNCSIGIYTPVFTPGEAMEHRLKAIELIERVEAEG